jgi:hypothetical protein
LLAFSHAGAVRNFLGCHRGRNLCQRKRELNCKMSVKMSVEMANKQWIVLVVRDWNHRFHIESSSSGTYLQCSEGTKNLSTPFSSEREPFGSQTSTATNEGQEVFAWYAIHYRMLWNETDWK